MLLAALVAFVGTLIAFAGVTALLRGWFETREGYLLTCGITLLCLSAGLGAATIGLALEFDPTISRAYVVGVALLAMVWLALGGVELAARSYPVKFVARLLVVSLTIVAGVILAVDPLREGAETGPLPAPDELYMPLPLIVLAVAHALVVLAVSGCFFTAAIRAWRGDEVAGDRLLPSLMVLMAALSVFVATRPDLVSLPPLASISLVTGAAVLMWVAPVRALRALEPEDEDDGDAFVDAADDAPGRRRRGSGGEPPAESHGAQAQTAPEPARPASPLADRTTTQLSGYARDARLADSLPDACGFIVIFTLREGAARPFDRLAEATVRAIEDREPGTLIYACHAVADAPQQRIFYELYRDRAAMHEHERQQHIRRFIAEREQYVLATNVVRLKLNSSTGLSAPAASA